MPSPEDFPGEFVGLQAEDEEGDGVEDGPGAVSQVSLPLLAIGFSKSDVLA